MITVGKLSGRKTPPSKTNMMYYQIWKITIHLQCKFLQERIMTTRTRTQTQRDSFQHPVLQAELDDSNTSPSPPFIVIQNLETICGLTKQWVKTVGQTTMPHVTHLSFVTPRIAFSSIIFPSILDPYKIHIMSCLHSKNIPSTLYQRLDTF